MVRYIDIGTLFKVVHEASSSKPGKKNILPLNLYKLKRDTAILCANTHIMNILLSTLSGWTMGATLNMAFGAGIKNSIKYGGIFAALFSLQPTIEQMFARDFVLVDKNLPNEFSDDGMGIPIVAVNDGKVVAADKMRGGYGNVVMIQHGDWCYSAYGHLQTKSIMVKAGQKVKQGQQIGCLGNTGNSSAPHLHFEMLYTNPDRDIPLLPIKVGRPLSNFAPFKFIELDMSEVYFSGNKKKPLAGIISKMGKEYKVNSTGDIPSFCLIK